MIHLSTSKELEGLKNKRSELEQESRSLKEEQQTLEERVRMLEEQIAIEELRSVNKTAHENISQLECKINELEQRLKETSRAREPEPPEEIKQETMKSPEPPEEETATETVQETPEEPEDESVTVMPLDNPPPIEQPESEDYKKHEKKKRKFF
jgi:chromosome segregation ATPase